MSEQWEEGKHRANTKPNRGEFQEQPFQGLTVGGVQVARCEW